MDLSVELQRPGGRAVERRSVRLTWSNPRDPGLAATRPRSAEASAFPLRKLEPDEIATLLRRGEDFFANGDVAAARLMLQRAAEAGDARAALALATTYDPITLGDSGMRSAFADPDMARTWYERAKAFGSPDAPRRLEMLASRTH
jgi:TPR repeat protein